MHYRRAFVPGASYFLQRRPWSADSEMWSRCVTRCELCGLHVLSKWRSWHSRISASSFMSGPEIGGGESVMQGNSGMQVVLSGYAALTRPTEGLTLSDSFEPYDQALLCMDWAVEQLQPVPAVAPKPSVETAERILALLRVQPKLSAKVLAQQLGLSLRAVELQLAKLKALGRLQRVGPNKGAYGQVLE